MGVQLCFSVDVALVITLAHRPRQAVFIGNGLVAILSGLLANYLVRNLDLGPVAPFDAAIVLLAIGGVLIFATWPENHGNESSKDSEAGGIVGGIHTQVCRRPAWD
jgi:drug/metabolite transporter (DMT)-like permease